MLSKEFAGGILIMTGANSAVGLRSTPARYIFLDEVDAYPASADAGDTTSMIFYLKTQAGWRETAGLHVSAAPPPGEDQSPDAAFRFFVDRLDQIGAWLGQQVEPVSTQRHMIVEAQVESAREVQR